VRVIAFTSDDDPANARTIVAAGAEAHFDKARIAEMIDYISTHRSAKAP
jgi:hypothetical protein